jgi:hypothetical protein
MKQHADPRTCCRCLKEGFDELGIENFTYEVLWEGDNSQLGAMEKQFIASEDTMYPNGYNLRTGGGKSERVSDQSRRGMIEKQREIRRRNNGGMLGFVRNDINRWVLKASVDGKHRVIGSYLTEAEARQAHQEYSADPDNFKCREPTRKPNGSGGIYKRGNKWRVMPYLNGANTYLGSFTTREEAERALGQSRNSLVKR